MPNKWAREIVDTVHRRSRYRSYSKYMLGILKVFRNILRAHAEAVIRTLPTSEIPLLIIQDYIVLTVQVVQNPELLEAQEAVRLTASKAVLL